MSRINERTVSPNLASKLLFHDVQYWSQFTVPCSFISAIHLSPVDSICQCHYLTKCIVFIPEFYVVVLEPLFQTVSPSSGVGAHVRWRGETDTFSFATGSVRSLHQVLFGPLQFQSPKSSLQVTTLNMSMTSTEHHTPSPALIDLALLTSAWISRNVLTLCVPAIKWCKSFKTLKKVSMLWATQGQGQVCGS